MIIEETNKIEAGQMVLSKWDKWIEIPSLVNVYEKLVESNFVKTVKKAQAKVGS